MGAETTYKRTLSYLAAHLRPATKARALTKDARVRMAATIFIKTPMEVASDVLFQRAKQAVETAAASQITIVPADDDRFEESPLVYGEEEEATS